jgi:chromate transporter
MLARGRIGGFLAGLAFMLPGFVLMLLLSWLYVDVGIGSPALAAAFAGCQAAVIAIIVRGVHRIGTRAVHDRWLGLIAVSSLVASLAGMHFALPLAAGGLAYIAAMRGRFVLASVVLIALIAAGVGTWLLSQTLPAAGEEAAIEAAPTEGVDASPTDLFATGLQGGALTFGGAYTAIPFIQDDAVRENGWMTNQVFLDGLALSGVIPAPLIIFATFVGYVAGGFVGAMAITIGMFLPAFAMTLLGHRYLEAGVANERLHAALDGITAGVIGLVTATTIVLFGSAIANIAAAAIFGAALSVLYAWRAGLAMPVVVIGAGIAGVVVFGGLSQ